MKNPTSRNEAAALWRCKEREGHEFFLNITPPISTRSCGSLSSPTAHITFCTLIEVVRPQILSMVVCLFQPNLSCPAKAGHPVTSVYRCCALAPGTMSRTAGSSAYADDDSRKTPSI